jgi:transcriptional regulator with XRE-family HTH domain
MEGPVMMKYVKRIRDLREDQDKTQEEIARILGTSQTMYARYERGANELPIRHLIALCKFYNVSADYLLGTAPNPMKKQKIISK